MLVNLFHWKRKDKVEEEKLLLVEEIRKAQLDWMSAKMRLDWVVDRDQVDYAIYALEAAEKRYEMLIRQAKKFNWVHVPFAVHEPVDAPVSFFRTFQG